MRRAISKSIYIVTIAFILALPVLPAACIYGPDDESGAATAERPDAEDRLALVAAQSILINTQDIQEKYFNEHQTYAPTVEELKTTQLKVNDRLVVVSGDAAGYEMQITANDSRQTLVIVRKKGTAVEKVDGNGKSW